MNRAGTNVNQSVVALKLIFSSCFVSLLRLCSGNGESEDRPVALIILDEFRFLLKGASTKPNPTVVSVFGWSAANSLSDDGKWVTLTGRKACRLS